MIQTNLKLLNIAEFIAQYGNQNQYELIDEELIDLEPTGLHEQVIGVITRKFHVEIDNIS